MLASKNSMRSNPSRSSRLRFVAAVLALALLLFACWSVRFRSSDEQFRKGFRRKQSTGFCRSVDVVFTWVNGSDPALLRDAPPELADKLRHWQGQFRDYGTLRFAMRSVERFAPWVRRIVLVTNGQRPDWLNASSPRVTLVSHRDLFADPRWLPTFSSPSIESQFPRLPLAADDCYFYLNDDVLFTNFIRLEEYVDAGTGAQFIDQWSLRAPQTAKPDSGTDVWHDAIRFTNRLVNRAYHAKQRGGGSAEDAGAAAAVSSVGSAVDRDNDADAQQRTDWPSQAVRAVDEGDRPLPPNDADDDNDGHEHLYSGHECQFFQNRIVQVIAKRWGRELAAAGARKTRSRHDVALAYLYAQVAIHEFGARRAARDNFYAQFTESLEHNARDFATIRKNGPNCICLNDRLPNYSPHRVAAAQRALEAFLLELFPLPSSFELQPLPPHLVPSPAAVAAEQARFQSQPQPMSRDWARTPPPASGLPAGDRLPTIEPVLPDSVPISVYVPFTFVLLARVPVNVARALLLLCWIVLVGFCCRAHRRSHGDKLRTV